MTHADYDVDVRVYWGDGEPGSSGPRPVLLWRRKQPAWHMAAPFEDHGEAVEAVDSWAPGWEFRSGKEMRRARFRHK